MKSVEKCPFLHLAVKEKDNNSNNNKIQDLPHYLAPCQN